jgi:hypothetical protein
MPEVGPVMRTRLPFMEFIGFLLLIRGVCLGIMT